MSTNQGNLSKSMRDNYAAHGVTGYYSHVGKTYRNPHFSAIKTCISAWLNKWWQFEQVRFGPGTAPIVFDLACGSGEVTICVLDWYHLGRQRFAKELQDQAEVPVQTTSSLASEPPNSSPRVLVPQNRRNKTKEGLRPPPLPDSTALPHIIASDPHTSEAYFDRTRMKCASLSFQDIAQGAALPIDSELPVGQLGEGSLPPNDTGDNAEVEMVICSFALHLIETPSELFALLSQLSTKARWLVVIAPHKKPEIKDGWGWVKWDVDTWSPCGIFENKGEILRERVHCRVYKSVNTV